MIGLLLAIQDPGLDPGLGKKLHTQTHTQFNVNHQFVHFLSAV